MRVRSDQGATLSLCCCLLSAVCSAVTSSKIDFLGIHKHVLYGEETALKNQQYILHEVRVAASQASSWWTSRID